MKFSDSHEWVDVQGETATIGITDHAQKELGEIVYVQLPEVGQTITANQEIVVVESTKAAVDIYSPVSGTVVAINESLQKEPGLLNQAAQKEGWLFQLALSDLSELEGLLDQEQYLELFS